MSEWNKILRRCLPVVMAALLVSCGKEPSDPPRPTEKTLFIYMPWSTNLTSYFLENISDMESAIERCGLNGQRVVVFLSLSPEKAELFEIECGSDGCRRTVLKEYADPPCTSADGLASILGDVRHLAPAERYAMAIGCHGMGWLPVPSGLRRTAAKMHWEYAGVPLTRYFGGLTLEYQTDVETLAQAIAEAGMKMEYILFDDCYMSSVEVAYALRHAADYLIASTSEMMAHGLPYDVIGPHLLGDTDYEAVCRGFIDFYSSYRYPYGTLAVTDCRRMDGLADVMHRINSRFAFDETHRGDLQRLDGYTPVLFHDLGRYVYLLCGDDPLGQEFLRLLDAAVVCRVHTPFYYSMAMGALPIEHFSGLTTSAASLNPHAEDLPDTEWWRDTN